MKPNMTNNTNPQTEHTPSMSYPPLPENECYYPDPIDGKMIHAAMVRAMSFQRTARMLRVFHDIQQELIDHLTELSYLHEDGDVSIYIPKGMVDAAGIAMGDPMDIEMDEDGLYISKAKDIGDPDSLFSKFLSFLERMEAEDEE